MPSDLQTIAADPEFARLSPADKAAVIAHVDPSFSSLSADDQATVMSHMGNSVADRARQHLAAMQPNVNLDTGPSGILRTGVDIGKRFLHGAGVPLSVDEARQMGDSLDPVKQFTSHPIASLAGPLGLAASGLLHTIGSEMGQQAGEGIDAAQAGDLRGAARHALGAAVPLVGPPAAEGDYAGAAGRLANLIAPEALKALPRVAPAIERAGVRQFADTLAPADSPNRPLAESIGSQLGGEGVRMSNPRKQLAPLLDERASAIDTEAPILNRPTAARTGPILADLAQQREALFNEIKRVPAAADPDLRAAQIQKLEKSVPMGEVTVDGNELVVKDIRHPSFWTKANELNKISQHISENSNRGMIRNDVLNNLTKDYNYVSGQQGAYSRGPAADIRLPADANAANAIRDVVNADPSSAAANAAKSELLKAKAELPATAQAPRSLTPIVKSLAKNAVVGVGSMVAGHGGIPGAAFGEMYGLPRAAINVGELANRIRTNPLFRTTAGGMKIQLGRALQSGDAAAMSNIAARVIGGAALGDEFGHDEAVHDAVTGAMDQAGGNEDVARQILSGKGAEYENPDGSTITVPFHVLRVFINKTFQQQPGL